MISRTYDPAAKRFVSLGEMSPLILLAFRFAEGAKRNGREIDADWRARSAEALRFRGSGTANPGARGCEAHPLHHAIAHRETGVAADALWHGPPPPLRG
jgi:hypothetical protein